MLSKLTIIAAAFLAAILLGGCESAHVAQSVTTKFSADDPESQMNFWHELAIRRLTSNDDAFHGVLLDVDGKDKSENYGQRVAALKLHGMLPDSFSEPADLAIERGTLALIVAKAMDIKGGWALHVFPGSQRYALRELVYENIFPQSSTQQTFSGSEFVGIIGKMDDYQKTAIAEASSPQK